MSTRLEQRVLAQIPVGALTSAEAMKFANCSRSTLERAWRDGSLVRTVYKRPNAKQGAVRYQLDDLRRWLNASRSPV